MMKKLRKMIFSPKGTLVTFGAAVVLLLLSSVGGARAALTYISNEHTTQISTQKIGVSLLEEKKEVAVSRDSDSDQVGDGKLELPALSSDEKVKPGERYAENLTVKNSGEIDQYVRVTVYKYWEKDGKKQKDLYPSYIRLDYADGWTVDTEASTQEMTVLYYTGGPLAGSEGDIEGNGEVAFVKSFWIDPKVSGAVKSDGTYAYQGCSFGIEVNVDAVQTHNAEDAILSAWGRKVTVDSAGGRLTLN